MIRKAVWYKNCLNNIVFRPRFLGVLKFARLIKSYESQDPEIASMSGKLKSMFLPPMTLPPHGAGAGGAVATS